MSRLSSSRIILDEREITLHAWGCNNPAIPAWQRLVLKLLFPLLRFLIRNAFRITPGHYQKAVEHIEALMAEVESKLGDGRKSILGGNTINFTDLTFTAIMGAWLQPQGYGGGWTVIAAFDPSAQEIRVRSYRIEDIDNDCSHDGVPATTEALQKDLRGPQTVVSYSFPDARPASLDNCPSVANPDQKDSDGDGIGDACNSVCSDGLTDFPDDPECT